MLILVYNSALFSGSLFSFHLLLLHGSFFFLYLPLTISLFFKHLPWHLPFLLSPPLHQPHSCLSPCCPSYLEVHVLEHDKEHFHFCPLTIKSHRAVLGQNKTIPSDPNPIQIPFMSVVLHGHSLLIDNILNPTPRDQVWIPDKMSPF